MTFKELRDKAKLSVSTSSKQLGIKEKTLYKYEAAIRNPSLRILVRMTKVYNCTYEEIIEAYKDNTEKAVSKFGKCNP